jgi:hypothetical protein
MNVNWFLEGVCACVCSTGLSKGVFREKNVGIWTCYELFMKIEVLVNETIDGILVKARGAYGTRQRHAGPTSNPAEARGAYEQPGRGTRGLRTTRQRDLIPSPMRMIFFKERC